MSFESMYKELPTLNSLQDFPTLPKKGSITVCEINTQLQTAVSEDPDHPADASCYTHLTENYFLINANKLKPFLPQKIHSVRIDNQDDSFLLSAEQSYFKTIWDGWYDNGLAGVIQGLRKSGGSPVLANTLTIGLNIWRRFCNIKQDIGKIFFPHLQLSPEDLIERYACVRSWSKSWIRGIAWHPNVGILAIGLKDDSIRVFCQNSNTISLLKSGDQKMVSSLSWRAFSDELAVGTEKGIVIWDNDYTIKTGSARSRLFTLDGHCPVTSVDYNNSGYWLLTSSSADASMIIWDANSKNHEALMRFGGGGVPRAKWSPNCATKIFSSSPTSVFRLWTQDPDFNPKRWTTPSKNVEAFAWSPCGMIILFVSDSTLYSISLNPSQIEFLGNSVEPIATPLFDLKECLVPQMQSDYMFKVGGQVLDIAWDDSGKRLAVLFDNSDLIALFRIETKSSKFIFPCGFIQGHDGEYPRAITFQKGFSAGALLTIAWSTQRVQYFPMIFAESGTGNYIFQQESRRLDRPQQRFVGPNIVDNLRRSGAFSPDCTPRRDIDTSFRRTSFKLYSP